MNLTVVDITFIRDGVWGIVYTAECDCGCDKSRHIATYKGTKPTDLKAKEIIDADYDTRKTI